MFGENTRLVVYPDTGHIDVKGGVIDQFGFGVKNLLEGSNAGTEFRYEVIISDGDLQKKCGVSEKEAQKLKQKMRKRTGNARPSRTRGASYAR